jgi:uncharacterized protein
MKKIYLVHGWSGNPNNAWFPWLREKLQQAGFQTNALVLPTPDDPDPETWPAALESVIHKPDKETYLVGHSIGCQTIMRYLEKLPAGTQVGGVVFVAPFFDLFQLKTQEEKDIWAKWKNIPINTDEFKSKTKNIVSIFSDNDADVDYDANAPLFEKLGSKIILEKNKGHFSDDAGVTELAIVLDELVKMTTDPEQKRTMV